MTGKLKRARTGNLARAAILSAMTSIAFLNAGLGNIATKAQEQAISIDLSPGPLSTAVKQLAVQSGLQIGYDSSVLQGMSTGGLSGQYGPSEALAVLLAGTGVDYTFTGPRTVTLTRNTASADGVIGTDDGTEWLPAIQVFGEKLTRDGFETYTSVGVATAQDLEDYVTQDLEQALNRMANVRASTSGDGNANFSIRGLDAEGVTQPSRSTPIISVTIDGALQGVEATRRGSRSVWDVEQIEVLRGPQSTIQGRNALGGAVIIKTKDPTWVPELIFDGQLGTDDYKSAAFALSTPIVSDQVAIRIAGQIIRDNNDIDYPDPTIASLGDDEFEEIRAKLLVTPDALPDFTGLFTISHTHDKPAWNAVTGPDYFAREFVDTDGSTAEFRDTKVNRYVADLTYDLAPGWELRSVTALTDTDVEIQSVPNSSLGRDDTRDGKDFSQDLRLVYDSDESRISGVFGLFAGRFTNDVDSLITTDYFAGFGLPAVPVQDLTAENKTTSYAAYTDLRYKLTDRFTILGGGRLLQDTIATNYQGEALDLAATLASGYPVYGSLDEDTSKTDVVFLPKLGVAFDINDNHTISAFASRGYRAGFSETIAGSTEIHDVAPEYLWSYELAYRSRWMDDSLEVFANAFYYDYDNQQILTYNTDFPGQTITQNAGKSHAYGAEVEARYRPTDGLELFASLGLLHTEFDDAITSVGDISGNSFPEAPSVTATIGGFWRHDSGFFASADVSYTDGFYSTGDLDNTASRYVDSFTIVNAKIGYEFEHMTIAAFARNLFDEQYLTGISENGTQATIGEGLSVGIHATAKF